MTEKTEAVFMTLSEAFAKAKEQLGDAIREATVQGRFAEAQRLIQVGQELQRLSEQVDASRQRWLATPEEGLIKQVFGEGREREGRKSESPRLPRGVKTQNKAYRLPILRALTALGGKAPPTGVLERVFAEMKARLSSVDLEPLPSDPHIPRWNRTAQWERYKMVKEGLLRADSPIGMWELTDKGRRYLEQTQKQGGERA